MKLSILDQAPISSNQTAKDALNETVKLAKVGEDLGFTRYWIAEHHNLPGLACSAPEVLLSYIGANTNSIRIGSGAILLPYYKPYKVAEVFNTLATLFPNRIDLGIGRAPGGPAEASNALSDNFLQQVWKTPDLIKELLHFLDGDGPSSNEYSKLLASPVPNNSPIPWILGTSKKSAILAAENGLKYAFGQFMSEVDGAEIIKEYLQRFSTTKQDQKPEVILAVSAVCAETTERAEEIALSSLVWRLQKENIGQQCIPSIEEAQLYKLNDEDNEKVEKMKRNMIIGTPQEVTSKLYELKQHYQADEMMIITITHSLEDRINSYKLISKGFI